jgi:hypothetical protein
MVEKALGVIPNYRPSGILWKNRGPKYRQTATSPLDFNAKKEENSTPTIW